MRIAITLAEGRRVEKFIEHAVGSSSQPMSDSQLEGKFRGLSEGVLSKLRTDRLIELCWSIEKLADAGEVARAGAAG